MIKSAAFPSATSFCAKARPKNSTSVGMFFLRATSATYMAAVSWTYPQDELIALQMAAQEQERTRPIASGLNVTALNFRYRIDGDRPEWRPLRVFDDGTKTYVEFPVSLANGEAPPLFIVGADGKAELVNYRLRNRFYIVDRIFDVAELRLGLKKQQIVRIDRVSRPAKRRSA